MEVEEETEEEGKVEHVDGVIVTSPSSTPMPAAEDGRITLDQVMMSSLRNKNKRKGFKLSMMKPIPQKVVFGGGVVVPEAFVAESSPYAESDNLKSQLALSASASITSSHTGPKFKSTSGAGVSGPLPRLIPPSELQELGKLPPNMFVTSVDVEDGLWTKSKRRKKKKKTEDVDFDDGAGHSYEDSGYCEDSTTSLYYGEADDQANVGQFADADAVSTAKTAPQSQSTFDWVKAEASWETGVSGTFATGSIVGWKVRLSLLCISSSDFFLCILRL